MSTSTLIGAVIGLGLGIGGAFATAAAFDAGVGFGFLALGAIVLVTTVLYILANASDASKSWGHAWRGFLTGTKAGLDATFLGLIFGVPAGVIVGLVIGIVVFLSAIDAVAGSNVYQGFLGWLNWLMPTSWLVVGLGLAFFVVNLLGHVFGYWIGRSDFARVRAFKVDWKTGSFFTKGGFVSNLNAWDTAFNMGNFAFVDSKNTDASWDMEHEAGHNLNLGGYGSVFHFVGFFDEVVFGNEDKAYAERIADSNDPATTNPQVIGVWN
jgi:hypothetical protein